jgi:hypothetical protein
MPKITRNQCLLVLLVVLISHVALTIHSGTHLAVDQQGCELCTQHANLTYAVPPAVALSFAVGQDAPETASETAPAPSAAILPYHQRAPPRNT